MSSRVDDRVGEYLIPTINVERWVVAEKITKESQHGHTYEIVLRENNGRQYRSVQVTPWDYNSLEVGNLLSGAYRRPIGTQTLPKTSNDE